MLSTEAKALGEVEYSSLLAKIALRSVFEEQFAIPDPPPKVIELFLKWYEKYVLRIDLSGIKIDRPIFLIALPRSGSTMVQDILCSHPDVVYITNTMHQFRACFGAAEHFRKKLNLKVRGERYLKDSVLVDLGSPSEGIVFWGEWFREDPHPLKYVPRFISDFSLDELDELYTTIKKVIWCFQRKEARFFNKNPGLLPRIKLLQDLFPDAKFIHLIRDPRLCANSLVKLYRLNLEQLNKLRASKGHSIYQEKPFIPYPRLPGLEELVEKYGVEDIRTTAHLWNKSLEFVNQHRNMIKDFYEVRYEDILANPVGEIGKILEFCELSPVPESSGMFWEKLGQVGHVHHRNRYGQYEVIESICCEWMQRYGYL